MSDILRREQLPPMDRWQLQEVAERDPGRHGDLRAKASSPPQSAAALEALQQQAWDEAYARGLAAGREAGREAGRAASEQEQARRGERLDALLAALGEPLEAVDEAVEEELAQLALAVARQILRRELAVDPAHVIAAVREALGELPVNSRAIQVLLNPDDAQLVRESLPRPGSHAHWEIVEDPMIARGGCQVQSADSSVDASLEARIATVAARVLGGDREDDPAAAAAAPTPPDS